MKLLQTNPQGIGSAGEDATQNYVRTSRANTMAIAICRPRPTPPRLPSWIKEPWGSTATEDGFPGASAARKPSHGAGSHFHHLSAAPWPETASLRTEPGRAILRCPQIRRIAADGCSLNTSRTGGSAGMSMSVERPPSKDPTAKNRCKVQSSRAKGLLLCDSP